MICMRSSGRTAGARSALTAARAEVMVRELFRLNRLIEMVLQDAGHHSKDLSTRDTTTASRASRELLFDGRKWE